MSRNFPEGDIHIVMEQAGVSRNIAINTLCQENGDIVNTIMYLTMEIVSDSDTSDFE